jgi:hypothetical protein
MDDNQRAEELIKRFVAAVRTRAIYSSTHPIPQRCMDAMCAVFDEQFRKTLQFTIGFLGDDVILGRSRLRGSAAAKGLVRHFRELQVEKISFSKGMGHDSLRCLVGLVAERNDRPFSERLAASGVKGVSVGMFEPEEVDPSNELGVVAAKLLYGTAVTAAEKVWSAAKAGEEPDADAARAISSTRWRMRWRRAERR